MKQSHALVHLGNVRAPEAATWLQRMRAQSIDEGPPQPRVWMEALERRVMLSNPGADTSSAFGYSGETAISISGVPKDSFFYTPSYTPAIGSGPNGKIYVATAVPSTLEWAIGCVNADGTPDRSFGTNGEGSELVPVGLQSDPHELLVQPDGRLIVISSTFYGSVEVARFNPDGSLDENFGGGIQSLWLTRPFIGESSILSWLTPDGKVVLMTIGSPPMEAHGPSYGWPGVASAETDMMTIRLNSDGTLDESFAPGGFVVAKLPGIAGQSPSYVVSFAGLHLADGGAVAYFDTIADPYHLQFVLTRAEFNDQGQIVSWKWIDTRSGDQNGHYIALGPDGSAYVIDSYGVNLPVVRLDPSGTVDPTYSNVFLDTAYASGILVTPPGEVSTLYDEGSTFLPDQSFLAVRRMWDPESGNLGFAITKTLADGSAPDSAIVEPTDPEEPSAGNSGAGDAQDVSSDPTGGFGSWDGYAYDASTPTDNALFADIPGTSIWNPAGRRDVFDEGAA